MNHPSALEAAEEVLKLRQTGQKLNVTFEIGKQRGNLILFAETQHSPILVIALCDFGQRFRIFMDDGLVRFPIRIFE